MFAVKGEKYPAAALRQNAFTALNLYAGGFLSQTLNIQIARLGPVRRGCGPDRKEGSLCGRGLL